MSQNTLPNKEKALVGIGAAVAAGCRPCVHTLIRAARAEGACERGIRLAIETGLYAGTCATRAMAEWAQGEQGGAPELDASFRAEKERLTALILAGASLAANSGELLGRYVGEAQALDWSKEQIGAALAAARTVARTAAGKIDATTTRLGLSLSEGAEGCCPSDAETVEAAPVAAGGCGCGKGTACP
jgi:AhpD family alkylhydroperoxidase